jgi:hypothetical protein
MDIVGTVVLVAFLLLIGVFVFRTRRDRRKQTNGGPSHEHTRRHRP